MRKFMLIAALGLATVAWAQSPFAGTWKLNPAKGHYTDATFSYTETSPGHFVFKSGSYSYEFNVDGKEYPTVIRNSTVSWQKTGPNQWHSTYKLDEKITSQADRKLSDDGKIMIVTGTSTADDGIASPYTNKSERVSGGPGLAGIWKVSNVKFEENDILVISEPTSNSMKVDDKHNKIVSTGATDGQTPWTFTSLHPDAMEHVGYILLRTGPGSVTYTNLLDGKVIGRGEMKVSQDGLTLTDTSWDVRTPDEKTMDVYEKQ
jgi:hypothetical protein